MKALLSIKPEFVNEILAGNKKYEYRKKFFKQDIDAIVIYASMPMGKIIGEFTIDGIINDNPMTVWKETKEYAGISFENYKKYFKGKREAYAICIKDLKIYEKPIDPYEQFPGFVPPQSYKYIKNQDMQNTL